jgi:hypothetical protein
VISSLCRILIAVGCPPSEEYVVVDGRDASCMTLKKVWLLLKDIVSCRQAHNAHALVSEFIVPPRIHRKMIDENVYFPSVGYGPKPCPISVCSFLDAHYENLALDIAVREYGFSCVVVVHS